MCIEIYYIGRSCDACPRGELYYNFRALLKNYTIMRFRLYYNCFFASRRGLVRLSELYYIFAALYYNSRGLGALAGGRRRATQNLTSAFRV